MAEMETREVFLPAEVLDACLDNWDTADDEALAKAVGESMEHAYWHWRWVLAVRAHRCRLVVVQGRDAAGKDMDVHYQLGDVFTLSGWHPERAMVEAQKMLSESGDGLTFDLPVDADMLDEWNKLAATHELEADNALEILATAMVLMDAAHDEYVAELGESFYIATRGQERDLRLLVQEEAGQWSLSTVQVMDKVGTVNDVHIHMTPSDDARKPVPVAFAPVEDPDAEELLA
ncbi:MAG: hypothetical protein WAZ18_07445 [Alphaproteobacteria bacterium]